MVNLYLDFDLALKLTDDGWFSHVTRSPFGEARAPFQMPLSGDSLSRFWEDVNRDGVDVGLGSPRHVGERLYRAAFGQEVDELWHTCLNVAYRNRQRLRLRLFGADVSGLLELPWEYLYDHSREEYPALSMQSPLTRCMELRHHIRPLPVQSPLRVLVIITGPGSLSAAEADRRWLRMIDALDYLAHDGRMIFERLEKPTLLDLQRRLRQGTYHVVHFIGNIGDPLSQDGELLLEDEMGRGRAVTGRHLGSLLRDHYSLRLVTLMTLGAWSPKVAPGLLRIAHSLVVSGIPAAVAVPFELPEDVERVWLQEFLSAVANRLEIDIAMAEARNAVVGEIGSALWGVPVLYSRAPNGQLFLAETETSQMEPVPSGGTESLLAQVLNAIDPNRLRD